MLKNISKLEVLVEGKIYNFLCDMDSNLNHVKEALFQFQNYVGKIEEQIKAAQEAQAKLDAEKAVPPPEAMIAPEPVAIPAPESPPAPAQPEPQA
jgi:hypothetical protein